VDSEVLKHLSHEINLFSKITNSKNVYVAGGCLRDLDADKEINDIDIFIAANDALARQTKLARDPVTRPFTYAGQFDRLFRTKSKRLDEKGYSTLRSGLRLLAVEEIDHEPFKLQAIFYQHAGNKGPRTLLNYFDINLCKVSFDGSRVYRTDEYKKDVEEKTITIDGRFAGIERTQLRAEKLKNKFGYTIVNAPAQELPVQRATVDYSGHTYHINPTLTTSTWSTLFGT
jgi:hypothetical protein